MTSTSSKIRVAVNGYGVIGKRVADAVAVQEDMDLVGIADIAADWRLSVAAGRGFRIYASVADRAAPMRDAGLDVAGTLDDLLGGVDVVVDCTPKPHGAANAGLYRDRKVKFVVQGGEKHDVAGHSFVAEVNYADALGRDATRVVSCNTTSVVRTLTALKRAGLLLKARGRSCAGPPTPGRATKAAS